MMVCVLGPVLLSVLLTRTASLTSVLDVSAGAEPAAPCPERWLLFGQRCFAFYPVWSSWSAAESMCSQAGSNLASLHTPEEMQFVRQMTDTHTPVWLGGYQAPQGDYWFWSDGSPFRFNSWANQRSGNTREGGACMKMTPKNGELDDAPCGELRFYVCSSRASSTVSPGNKKPVDTVIPGQSVCAVLWGGSDSVVEEILRSPLLAALRSGRLSERCYARFSLQEALYLHRVSSSLQVLLSSVQGPQDIRALLLDTQKHYSKSCSRDQSLLLGASPSRSVRLSLRSFHSVVLDDPVYWLVVLSVRARLRSFLARELRSAPGPPAGRSSAPRLVFRPRPPAGPEADTLSLKKRSDPDPDPGRGLFSRSDPDSEPDSSSLFQRWIRDGLEEEAWAHRYTEVIEKYQDQIDLFKAINLFREHMVNQKSLYKSVSCVSEEEEDEEEIRRGGQTSQTRLDQTAKCPS